MKRPTSPIVLVLLAYCFALLFALFPTVLLPFGHAAPCPFAAEDHAACISVLQHMAHWQERLNTALASHSQGVLVMTLAILVLARRPRLFGSKGLARPPLRPTLLQELFSAGILNRKCPRLA